MTVREETVGDTIYTYDPDPPPPVADRWRAVVRARLIDEITREEVLESVALACEPSELVPRAATGGLVGAIGRPAKLFPSLGLAAVDIRLDVATHGYLPMALAGSLGPIAGFPDAFAPLDFGDVPLHRTATAIVGRIVRNQTFTQPIAGATVQLMGVWSTLPPPNWMPPALQEAPNIVALIPGLYARRNNGAAIARRDLTLSAQAKQLAKPMPAGQMSLVVSDRIGLAAGTVLVIDRDDPMRFEVIQIKSVDTTSTPDQPAKVTLEHASKYLHLDGVACTAATPQPPTTPTTFGRAGIAGDAVAILVAAPGFADGSFVEIDDGVAVREFQRIGRFETTSDADGFFRWPAIARIALARLQVQHAGFTDAMPIITLDYRAAIQRVSVFMETP
jgi:hypothetical protein